MNDHFENGKLKAISEIKNVMTAAEKKKMDELAKMMGRKPFEPEDEVKLTPDEKAKLKKIREMMKHAND